MKFLLLALLFAAGVSAAEPQTIDNAALLPPIRPDSEVKLEYSPGKAIGHPDWLKSLILVELNIETASSDRKFSGMAKTLDHLAETGVNGVWITPLHAGGHYGNHGIHTINKRLTGPGSDEECWNRVRQFVDECHKRNIRVFLDVISWGVREDAPLRREKPEWFTGEFKKEWDGWLFDWSNPELNEWFIRHLVQCILRTGADGFRCDCGPNFCKYEPYREARARLLKQGRKVIFFSEHASCRRDSFDFDQNAFIPGPARNRTKMMDCDSLLVNNIVDLVRSGAQLGAVDDYSKPGGTERFYAMMLSNHDSKGYSSQGDIIAFAYQAILSPFLPIWFLGEEWNNPYPYRRVPRRWLYDRRIDTDARRNNREFFETVKRMIRIRRLYPEIFEYFPDDHRKSNIAKVKVLPPWFRNRPEQLCQPYARYRGDSAVLVIPNNSPVDGNYTVTIPYELLEFPPGERFAVTDLLTGDVLATGTAEELNKFDLFVREGRLGVCLVAPASRPLRR